MTLPPLTKKEKEIIHIIFRFRFINRIQIQTLLHHKDHKTINQWLKDLTEKKYLQRNYQTTPQGRIQPAVYNLGINGIRYLKTIPTINRKDLNKYYAESKNSERFRKQSMLITDTYIALDDKYKNSITFFTGADFPVNGVIRKVRPSFGFIKQEDNIKIAYICEIFQYGRPRWYNQDRVRKYIDFFRDESNTKLLFVCSTQNLRNQIKKLTQSYLENYDVQNFPLKTLTFQELRNLEFF